MKRAGFFLAIIILFVSCNGEPMKTIERIFDLEARAAKGAPPSSIEELKKGINEYSARVNKTVEDNDKQAFYWRLLAVRYLDKKMYGPALEAAQRALEFYPDNSGLYYTVAVSAANMARTVSAEPGAPEYSRMEWLRTSEASYKESIALMPRNTRSWYGLAVLYSFELEMYDEAVEAIDQVLAIEKSSVDAMFVRARSLYGAGRLMDAIDEYDRIIKASAVKERREQAEDNKRQILGELYD